MSEKEAASVITRFAKRMCVKVQTKKELQLRMGMAKRSNFLERVMKKSKVNKKSIINKL